MTSDAILVAMHEVLAQLVIRLAEYFDRSLIAVPEIDE
jgi:hypothetical protein